MAYNEVQMGTVIAFGVTYFSTTIFLAARYFQSVKIDKKVDLDLRELSAS